MSTAAADFTTIAGGMLSSDLKEQTAAVTSSSEGSTTGSISDGTDDPMDIDSKNTSTVESSRNENDEDVLDINKLLSLLKQILSAGSQIAGEKVMLLIGPTGAGKTTTTLYLAGATFVETEIGGADHYQPSGLSQDILDEFVVSGSATSVTKAIHATAVQLPNSNETITICDTPGFGDTKGVEMEIANGLGVIHALKQAKSVKPVLVIDQETYHGNRFENLRKTLQIVALMMGKRQNFSPFQYAFTRCDDKKSKKIHKRIEHFQSSRSSDGDDDRVMDALLADMIQKTSPAAINIEPEEKEEHSKKLELLWSQGSELLENPRDAFNDFVAKESSNILHLQITRMLLRTEKSLKNKDYAIFLDTLNQLLALAHALPMPKIRQSVEEGQAKGRAYVAQVSGRVDMVVDKMVTIKDKEGFRDLIPQLQESVKALVELDSIVKVCQVPEEHSIDTVLQSSTKKVFVSIQSDVEKLQECALINAANWHEILQSALVRLGYTTEALTALIKYDETSSASIWDISSNLIKFHLSTVEESLKHHTTTALENSKAAICSLLEMKAFFGKGSQDEDKWSWLGQRLGDILQSLGTQAQVASSRLGDHAQTLENAGDFDTLCCPALTTLSSDGDIVEHRAFLLCLSTADDIWKGVEDHHGEVKGDDPGIAVAYFDSNLTDALTAFAAFAHEWAGEKHPHSDKKKAETLLKSVELALQVCKDYPLGNQEPEAKFNIAMGLLTGFIAKCKSMPQRPDKILYGPEEFGKRFYGRLVELRAYKVEHGDCDVPQHYKKIPGLGRWVNHIRGDAKRVKKGLKPIFLANEKRIEALADLDFLWESKRGRGGRRGKN